MEYISRAIEELTRNTRNTFKAILVTGAKQTGKLTMLRHLFPELRYVQLDDEIDLIIEQNGKYYPIEIKKNEKVSEHQASSFRIMDRIPGNKRGTGAIICNAAMPSQLGENLLCIPVWYI